MPTKEELLKKLEQIYSELGKSFDRGGKNFCGECSYCCTYNFLHGVSLLEYEYIYIYLERLGMGRKAWEFRDYIRKKRTVRGELIYTGCPLYDEEKKGCSIYTARPYSCRIFGLYGDIPPPLYCSYRDFAILLPAGHFCAMAPMAKELFEIKTLYEVITAKTGEEKADRYYTLGVNQYYRADPHGALPWLEKAIEENPGHKDALYQIAIYYYALGDRGTATKSIREALKYEEKDINLRLHLGLFLMEQGKFDEAKEEFIRVLDINPQNTMALTAMGNFFFTAGNMEKAEVYCKKALEINPSMEMAWLILKKIL